MERYSLHKVIGEGSFGRALLVRCKSTQEKYVVKEIQLPKVFANKYLYSYLILTSHPSISAASHIISVTK